MLSLVTSVDCGDDVLALVMDCVSCFLIVSVSLGFQVLPGVCIVAHQLEKGVRGDRHRNGSVLSVVWEVEW